MAIVVVGGQAKNVGKTFVVSSLIARLPERKWTACKITQCDHEVYGGDSDRRRPEDEDVAIAVERDPLSNTDTAHFLAAGASRSLLVRIRRGYLSDAMPCLLDEIRAAQNIIFESNSLLEFLRPDLYLMVLDPAIASFKDSALRFLDRADALLVRASSRGLVPGWKSVASQAVADKPRFLFDPPSSLGENLVIFVQQRLNAIATQPAGQL
jgi:hypothetical protein